MRNFLTMSSRLAARKTLAAAGMSVALVAVQALVPVGSARAETPPLPYSIDQLITRDIIEQTRKELEVPVVQRTIQRVNEERGTANKARIKRLDKQWRRERKLDDQPLITAIMANPVSSFLTRIQANGLGLYSEIFIVDANGLNVGQSAVTTDFWQGDEAKFQKTYPKGADAVFVDEAEFHEESGTWRAQLNFTVRAEGKPIGAATVEFNLTELARRKAWREGSATGGGSN